MTTPAAPVSVSVPEATALVTLRRACLRLQAVSALYAGLLTQINLRATRAIPSACVYVRRDGDVVMAVNPEFFCGLSKLAQEGMVEHELLHLVSMHSVQRGMGVFGDLHDPIVKELYGCAVDLAVNPYVDQRRLAECPAQFSGGLLLPQNVVLSDGPLPVGKPAIWYFNKLKAETERVLQGLRDNAEGRAEHDDGEGSDGSEDRAPQIVMEAVLKGLAARTLEHARKLGTQPGNLPAHMLEQLEEALKPRVNWRAQLRAFEGDALRVSTEPSRARPNRRYGFGVSGERAVYSLRILFGVDTSGSMATCDLAQAWGEFDRIAEEHEVVIACIDCALHSATAYEPRRTRPEFHGRGGTDFSPLWATYAANGWKDFPALRAAPFDAVIYFTDGYGEFPETNTLGLPTLWVCTTDADIDPPFGRVIRLPAAAPQEGA